MKSRYEQNRKTYEEGQIDALNGKEEFYLKEFSNGERQWMRRDMNVIYLDDHLIKNKSVDG